MPTLWKPSRGADVVIVLGNYVEEECLSELGVNRSCCGGLVQGAGPKIVANQNAQSRIRSVDNVAIAELD